MFRRGTIPAQGEQTDYTVHWWTRRGFFGSYSVLYKTHNPGDAVEWAPGLGPAYVDTAKLRPTDMDRPDGTPLPVLTNGPVTFWLSRRAEAMPYCWRNSDADELYFVDQGRCRFETEFGRLEAGPADMVFLPRNVVYRVVPLTADTRHVIVETEPFLESADAYHRQHGEAAHGLNMSAIEVPEPWENTSMGGRYEVRTKVHGEVLTAVFDFDPVGVTVGWAGDPVVFKLNAWDVPCASLPSTPPTAAVFMTDDKEAVVTVHTPMRGPGGGKGGPPAHSNDYDEVWFLHSAHPAVDDRVGLLRWDPQGATQPGGRPAPKPGAPPPTEHKRLNFNVDVRTRLRFTPEALPYVVEERAAALTLA